MTVSLAHRHPISWKGPWRSEWGPLGDGENPSLGQKSSQEIVQKTLGLRILLKIGKKKKKERNQDTHSPEEYHYVQKHAFSALAHLFVSHSAHASRATIGSEVRGDFISPGKRGLAHHLLF